MISYKEYFGDQIYKEIVHNPNYLKELYKLIYNVDKVPLAYSQKIKTFLLTNVSNSGVFVAFKDKKPIAFLKGSVTNNNFSIDAVSVSKNLASKDDVKKLEGKLILRSIAYMRVKKNMTNFNASYLLSSSSKLMFRAIASRQNKSSLNILPENNFSKKSGFKVFKKDKNPKNKVISKRR